MNTTLRKDADQIIAASLKAVLPDEAVFRALKSFRPGTGRTLLVAAGKAAWQMANAAVKALGRWMTVSSLQNTVTSKGRSPA